MKGDRREEKESRLSSRVEGGKLLRIGRKEGKEREREGVD